MKIEQTYVIKAENIFCFLLEVLVSMPYAHILNLFLHATFRKSIDTVKSQSTSFI